MEDLEVSFTMVLVQLKYCDHSDVAYVITVFWVDKYVALSSLLVAAILKLWPNGQLYSNTEWEQIVQLHQADRNPQPPATPPPRETNNLAVGLITD